MKIVKWFAVYVGVVLVIAQVAKRAVPVDWGTDAGWSDRYRANDGWYIAEA